MKLAEALALRADAARRVEQLRARVTAAARYQEGETPAEEAATLLAEAGAVLGELETLIRRINRTNAATTLEGGTLTDALARRCPWPVDTPHRRPFTAPLVARVLPVGGQIPPR